MSEEKSINSWISEVRGRLASPAPLRLPPSDARPAAVLVPLYVDSGDLWTLLAKRSEDLPHHQGQIAFPGGSLEAGEDSWDAALREAQEEVGLEPSKILRLGQLDEAATPSGFRIVPCVAAVPFPVETQVDQREIEEVFAVPVRALLQPSMVEEKSVAIDGREHQVRIYHYGGRRIWGLTARVLQNLLQRLGLEILE